MHKFDMDLCAAYGHRHLRSSGLAMACLACQRPINRQTTRIVSLSEPVASDPPLSTIIQSRRQPFIGFTTFLHVMYHTLAISLTQCDIEGSTYGGDLRCHLQSMHDRD